jgi:hypothetical protein
MYLDHDTGQPMSHILNLSQLLGQVVFHGLFSPMSGQDVQRLNYNKLVCQNYELVNDGFNIGLNSLPKQCSNLL